MVYAIHISSGEWVNTQDKANEAFLNFYKNLFTKKKQHQLMLAYLVNKGEKCNENNVRILNSSFIKDDVRRFVFSILDDKAPRADGFNSCFYKHKWEIIWDELPEGILDFFKTRELLKVINVNYHTHISA